MKKTVDARGLPCPEPVVLTLKAIGSYDEVTTIVDNEAAVENVSRTARSKGCSVQVYEENGGIHINMKREGPPAEAEGIEKNEHLVVCSSSESSKGPTVLFVPSDCFGRGPAELGERLMGAFFHSILEITPKPETLIFMNSGVKLAIEGSRALDDIRSLESDGAEILVCGTCLGYFELTEKLAVGNVSNMYDIAGKLLKAGKIVSL